VDRTIGLGSINDEGWFNFERVQLTSSDGIGFTETSVSVTIQSVPPTGEYKFSGENTTSVQIDNKVGRTTISGKTSVVNAQLF
jgi:hypothetical protein